ncbi:hypothetical protein PF005_g13014 [Phytophthora fragariae]|uniref:Uncharacterized protein n=1 Tax=Phytophthora fragariae TaxID=53985 RepID=A0A6A3ESQ8_9STRA|nr:hypothetical protein PF003_g28076 [Phytophthora fragariae]KAE8935457.1 hypothetical protein PF009_g14603 [Phytophthora fragariae]KAE9006316.1 hypothetical protein PF011_g11646 [Phytophthora fragariae]KAE9105298.1 hypothetical protein PF010_g13082 [Phytophthora fragariae]KAE9105827.1 hypothetical protein PF007_g13618 [Phytophthora fragariae]
MFCILNARSVKRPSSSVILTLSHVWALTPDRFALCCITSSFGGVNLIHKVHGQKSFVGSQGLPVHVVQYTQYWTPAKNSIRPA